MLLQSSCIHWVGVEIQLSATFRAMVDLYEENWVIWQNIYPKFIYLPKYLKSLTLRSHRVIHHY